MMRDVADQAQVNNASRIEIILAGDILDLYRTQYWFHDDHGLRPYVDCKEVTPALEAKLLSIIDGIAAEPEVQRSIAVFKRFAQGEYLSKPGVTESIQAFGVPTALHFLPGNHDRLANSTPTIRARVRSLLGLEPSSDSFPHQVLSTDPPVLVRHGHEYDRYNFAIDLRGKKIATQLPQELYQAPTWGDFNTVMVAARLPFLFRKHFTDQAILTDPLLQTIYCRLLEFDDVRPQAALVDFFLNTTVPTKFVNQDKMALATPGDLFPHREVLQTQMWAKITPVLRALIYEVFHDDFSRRFISRFFPRWAIFLALPLWRMPMPLWLARIVGRRLRHHAVAGKDPSESFAISESAIVDGDTCFVCAGHTHQPDVAHIFSRNDVKRYFTDSGTWRNAVLTAGDDRSYGRVNATTYITFYGKEVDPTASSSDHGFEFWTGYDQSWPVSGFDH
jgi:hypothetical protein